MTIALDNATPCVKFASLFQNPLLEDETSVETAADIRTQAALTAHAAKLCGECPLRAQCLTNAVVFHGVARSASASASPSSRRTWTVLPESAQAAVSTTRKSIGCGRPTPPSRCPPSPRESAAPSRRSNATSGGLKREAES